MGQLGPIHWKEFEKFLFVCGCTFKRERGDHRVYYKKGLVRPIIVPRDKNLPPFVISNNLRLLDVSTETFLKWLNKD